MHSREIPYEFPKKLMYASERCYRLTAPSETPVYRIVEGEKPNVEDIQEMQYNPQAFRLLFINNFIQLIWNTHVITPTSTHQTRIPANHTSSVVPEFKTVERPKQWKDQKREKPYSIIARNNFSFQESSKPEQTCDIGNNSWPASMYWTVVTGLVIPWGLLHCHSHRLRGSQGKVRK